MTHINILLGQAVAAIESMTIYCKYAGHRLMAIRWVDILPESVDTLVSEEA
jgi:hypothetical protein